MNLTIKDWQYLSDIYNMFRKGGLHTDRRTIKGVIIGDIVQALESAKEVTTTNNVHNKLSWFLLYFELLRTSNDKI